MQITLWLFSLFVVSYSANFKLKTEYEWKSFDYVWPSENKKYSFIKDSRYDPNKMIPIDVDRSSDGRTFITIIRSSGVPATLHTISSNYGETGPLLSPYPDWTWYENSKNCSGILNVFRVAIDKCNRLWVLDTGVIDDDSICPAKLLVFDLGTDDLLFKIEIPREHIENINRSELLVTPIVETHGKRCKIITIYMANVLGSNLVIWNRNKIFRLKADVFGPEEEYIDFNIAGESFNLSDGVLGMALSPVRKLNGNRILFFKPLASKSVYGVDTKALKHYPTHTKINYRKAVDVLPSQGTAMAFSSKGVLFYGLTSEIAIGCWNINKPFQSEYFGVVLVDYERLQFVSGIKVIKNVEKEELIIMTNRFQKFMAKSLNFNEINFRILNVSVQDIIKGTVCDDA